MEAQRILCPEVIGRDGDLGALTRWLGDVISGFGRTVLISGEAGLGKSALLRELAVQSRAHDARFLSGECVEIEALRPFGPFVQILRTIDREFAAGTLRRLLRETAPELGRLLPELRLAGSGAAAVNAGERYRIHESLVSLLRALGSKSPIVVAVEDLHWADEATLELLPYLARGLRGDRVMFVATYRSDEIEPLPLLASALSELERGRLAEGIELHGLTEEDTARMIQSALRLDHPPRVDLVGAIHSRCEGNPFFVEEALKALADRGDIVQVRGAWRVERAVVEIAIPVSVRLVVEQRTARLSPRARRVLQVAAVIGRRFDFELLRAAANVPDEALFEDLRAVIDAQLVIGEVREDGEERYAFRHALTREVVLGELLQRERRALHRSIGEILEARAGANAGGYTEDLAYHFDEAGDKRRASGFHQIAGREAFRGFAFARSVRHFERALDYTLELTPNDNATLGDLQLGLAAATRSAGDYRRSSEAADAAARLFEAAGDLGGVGRALYDASWALWDLGDSNAAADRTTKALRLLEPMGESPALADVYTTLSGREALNGRVHESVALAERALALARGTGAVRAEIVALRWLGLGLANQGRSDGVERSRECLDLALKQEDAHEAQIAYLFLGGALSAAGASWTEVRPWIDERVRHGRRHGLRPDGLIVVECELAIADGDWDAALRIATEARGATLWAASADMLATFVAALREGPESVAPVSDALIRRFIAANDAQWIVQAGAHACALSLIGGDMGAVLRHAEPVEHLVAKDLFFPGVSSVAAFALTAASSLEDTGTLRRWIDIALTQTSGTKHAHAIARRLAARAERAALDGDLDSAIAALAETHGAGKQGASTMAGRVELQDLLPTTLRSLRAAELRLRRGRPGDRAAAEAELAYVIPFWRKAKAVFYLGKLRAWAHAHGLALPGEDVALAVTTQSGAAARESRLTTREREVANLVSQGLSNRDIAERLVISERTAEGHVEQIRNKLGFHSRSQITAWVATNR